MQELLLLILPLLSHSQNLANDLLYPSTIRRRRNYRWKVLAKVFSKDIVEASFVLTSIAPPWAVLSKVLDGV